MVSMVPVCGLILQITLVVGALFTVAANCWLCPGLMFAVVGLIVTDTLAVAVRVIFAVPNVLESSAEVAVTVTVPALPPVIEAGAL